MNARTEIKIGENVVMSVPVCTARKCTCLKTVRKLIKVADDGHRMQAAFSYVQSKACPTVITLDPKALARAAVEGPQTLPRIMVKVAASLAVKASIIAVVYLAGVEVLKWLA